ncbi:diacylglycerol kinase family protein [Rhodoferax sp.]|uniref:diacylglycerol/lipid kinase family protein n=1 Tax=Rhodoferax sp. TaxID=50421 RepID=UPI0025FCC420|nr:diacylglycerol kinase family protein [Rhodoferax sp.]
MTQCPDLDPAAPLIFIINAASGRSDADAKRAVIDQALQAAGRTGELCFTRPADLPRVAREAAATALATRSAVVAVGGDGTINAVSQAAHAAGCAMGVVPLGTFNYFARTHGISTEPAQAAQMLMQAVPTPVQVGTVNGHVFLVNASLGLYPVLLEDRETYKARFGRSRWVALGAALMTLLRGHRQLHLHIDQGGVVRNVRTPTLFVGNNRLQLEQVGVNLSEHPARPLDDGQIAAVMLKPIGTLAMVGLMLHGAMGTLGEAGNVDSFAFSRMVVQPRRRKIKVAFDGEVTRMRTPLEFRVAAQPLYLLKSAEGSRA